jgi:hypothetical protein
VPSKTPSEGLDELKRLLGNRLVSSSQRDEFLQREFRLSDAELPAFLEESSRSVQAWLQSSGFPRSAPVEHARRILFSGDGRLLFCTTGADLRIFDWDALLASNQEFPEPRFLLAPEGHRPDTKETIVALVEDPRRNLLLIGTDQGRIGAVDLETGSQRTMLQIPGALPIGEMGLSTDGTVLYTTLCPEIARTEPGPRKPARFLVWDYARMEAQP